ncbi:MAG: hypothetical protein HY663_01165 [Chloroflexi bacterium]|nr:hypothetical protein [Chloroflexota bacterium]
MRTKAALVALLIIGAIVAANLLTPRRALSPGQLEKITTVCTQCHGAVPTYSAAMIVHDKHIAFNCSRCHSSVEGLRSMDSIHTGVQRVYIGIMLVGFAAIVTSAFVTRAKVK